VQIRRYPAKWSCLLWEGCKMPLADDVYRDKEPPKQ